MHNTWIPDLPLPYCIVTGRESKPEKLNLVHVCIITSRYYRSSLSLKHGLTVLACCLKSCVKLLMEMGNIHILRIVFMLLFPLAFLSDGDEECAGFTAGQCTA